MKHRLEQLDDFEEVSNPKFKTHLKQELEPSHSVQMFLIIFQIHLNCFSNLMYHFKLTTAGTIMIVPFFFSFFFILRVLSKKC